MTLKQKIYQKHQELLQDKIDVFQDMISGLTIDAQNDAKGSAGDKHETALSMMHIEQEKLNHKLKELFDQKSVLDKIDASRSHKIAALGSVVKTNELWVFIATALPKIIIDALTIFAVSPNAPLGSNLIGNCVGHVFEVNGKQYTIEEII